VLLAIYRIRDDGGNARVSDINARLGFLLPNTTKLLNELTNLMIVEKGVSSLDKRVVLVHATAKGEEYIRKYVVPYGTELQKAFSCLDEIECEAMIATIEKIYTAMKKVYHEEGQP
jgi:DNA-binding MarR family transcriptional regulator